MPHATRLLLCCLMMLAPAWGVVRAAEPSAETAPEQTADLSPAEQLHRDRQALLRRHDLADRALLIQFGQSGCEKSTKGLAGLVMLHQRKLVPGLSYARFDMHAMPAQGDEAAAVEAPPIELPEGIRRIDDPDNTAAKLFDATTVPTYVLVDRFGRVRYRGGFPSRRLVEWVRLISAETDDPGLDVPLFGQSDLNGPRVAAATVLPDLNGRTRPLDQYFGRGGLMVMFVDATCPFSDAAVDEVQQIADVLRPHGVPVVLIDLEDPLADTITYFRGKSLRLTVLHEATPRTRLTWDVWSVPTVVLFNTQRKVAYNGKAVWANVTGAAEKMLALSPGALSVSDIAGTEYG